MDNENHWCFAWPEAAEGANRAALLRGLKWNPGDTITISFLDGDPTLRERVKRVAKQWTRQGGDPQMANLFLGSPEALITRTVDYPHFSATQQCYDRVRTNLGTRRQRSLITHRPHTYLGRTRLLTLD